jgi:phenylpyruvate tautomerase PptA (4-oxalocrotonate tautomerase family)
MTTKLKGGAKREKKEVAERVTSSTSTVGRTPGPSKND